MDVAAVAVEEVDAGGPARAAEAEAAPIEAEAAPEGLVLEDEERHEEEESDDAAVSNKRALVIPDADLPPHRIEVRPGVTFARTIDMGHNGHESNNSNSYSNNVNNNKRPRRRAEPDVTVKVGRPPEAVVVFEHYSHILCFASDYFDAALHSGMKESHEFHFEFPDKSPEEWNLFASLLEPCCNDEHMITDENVEQLIPWFHQFRVSSRLQECEKLYQLKAEKLLTVNNKKGGRSVCDAWNYHLEEILRMCSVCSLYNLSKTKNWLIKQLKYSLLKEHPTALLNSPEHIPQLLELMKDKEFRNPLWDMLYSGLLPRNIKRTLSATSKHVVEEMLQNPLLPALIQNGIEQKRDAKFTQQLQLKVHQLETEKDALVLRGIDFPRKLSHALPKKPALKKKDECINRVAADRLNDLMKADLHWSKYMKKKK